MDTFANLYVYLLIPILLALVHLINAFYKPNVNIRKSDLRSFTAGFSVSYVFLYLLPEIANLGQKISLNTSVFTLIGFIFFHMAHKFVFKEKNPKKRVVFMDEVHLVALSVYNLLIAFFLVELTKINLIQGIITSIVIIVHTVLIEISQSETSRRYHSTFKSILAVLFTLTGGVLAIMGIVGLTLTVAFFALTAGSIVYISIREEIPADNDGRPPLFLIGVLVMYILLSMTPLY